jgi:hypothetical protein
MQVFQRFKSSVHLSNIGLAAPSCFNFLKNFHHQFSGGQVFVVSGGHHLRVMLHSLIANFNSGNSKCSNN